MNEIEFLIALLAIAAALVRLADAISIPYPIVLVVAGTGIGFLPGLEPIELDPDIIFLVFLPPLLHAAGFQASPKELRAELSALGGLVIGLVIVTVAVVGFVLHLAVPSLSWGEALLVGAIVSPTDPVAAIATFSRVGVPERVALVVEGEALVNDATALVLYRVILAGVLAGAYEVGSLIFEFTVGVAGGIVIGLALGWLAAAMQRRLDDPPLSILLSLVVPYVGFALCEEIGASGVLAAVASGLYLGWRSHEIFGAETRLNALAFWQALVFALNAILFILLGLQFPEIIDQANDDLGTWAIVQYGLLTALAVILIRLAWQFLPPALGPVIPGLRSIDTGDEWRERLVVGWSGMRGAVSLAAALALPTVLDSGAQFGNRSLIIFLTVATIIATLVVQGLTLPLLIRKLGLTGGPRAWAPDEAIARLHAAQAALDRIDEIDDSDDSAEVVPEPVVERMRSIYEARFQRCVAAMSGDGDGAAPVAVATGETARELRLELIGIERAALISERDAGRLKADILRRIQRELDLDEARLR